jgi:AraC-like DNA-binding protein
MARKWSTLTITPVRQFAYWRELICEAFLDLSPESDLRDGFTGIVTQWPYGDLSLAQIDSQRQRVRRTQRDVSRAPRGGYYANLQLRGTSGMTQAGRSAILRPGDVALVQTDEPFEFQFDTNFRQLSLYIPGRLLDAQLVGPALTSTRIDTTAGPGAAARHAMEALARNQLSPGSAARLAVLAGGLLAVALEVAAPTDEARARSVRSYRAAVADIEEHLTDDDLSPAATARRLGVSVRWLHQVFAGHEHTYSATVRRLRLAAALRSLQDPARNHLRVIDIAAEAGFGHVASFHRAFRQEFGRSPAQVRRHQPR